MFTENLVMYRLEGPDGNGPFNCEIQDVNDHSKAREINNRHCVGNNFPAPYWDGELKCFFEKGIHYFGFKTMTKFTTAFTKEELKEFIDVLEFKVYKITVSQGYKSKFQCMFEKEHIITKEDISHKFTD